MEIMCWSLALVVVVKARFWLTGGISNQNVIIYLNFFTCTYISLVSRPTFVHFVGASLYASNFQSMLVRLYEEINDILKSHNIQPRPTPKDDEIIPNIYGYLATVSQKVL
jgi:hypothetical protein